MKTIKIVVEDSKSEERVIEWFTLRNRIVTLRGKELYVQTSRYELKKFMEWANATHIELTKEWIK